MEPKTQAKLHDILKERIRAGGGAISFEEYMECCLYEPGAGYYMREQRKLGKEGDYYTSAFIGEVMGQCIAAKLAEAFRRFDSEAVTIIEWGGGDGRLASHILDELGKAYPEMYSRVRWIGAEFSPYHRKLQEERLARHQCRLEGIVAPDESLVRAALESRTCLLVANELLDAFPIQRLRWIQGAWREVLVAWDDQAGRFQEVTGGMPEGNVASWLAGISGTEGQYIEVNRRAREWIGAVGRKMREGLMLLIDYGGTTEELITPQRMRGTLMTYRGHRANDDAYEAPGEKDITSHVNFDWCIEAGREAGFCEIHFVTQKQFLVEQGVLNRLQRHDGTDPFSEAARNNRAIRQLLLSDGMSELFKVLEMYKYAPNRRKAAAP